MQRSAALFAAKCLIVVLAQIAVSASLAVWMRGRQHQHIVSVQRGVSARIASFLTVQMDSLAFKNRRNAAFLGLQDRVLSLSSFQNLLQLQYDDSANQVEAYEYIVRLEPSDVAGFNTFCAANINPKCFLKEVAASSAIDRTTGLTVHTAFSPVPLNRAEYYAVLYFEPLAASSETIQNLIGFDLLSYPSGQAEVKQFVDAGMNGTVTRRVKLVVPSLNSNSYGIIIGTPVYSANVTASVQGYATCVVRLETIIDRAIENIAFERPAVDIVMFDITNDGVVNIPTNNASVMFKERLSKHASVYDRRDMRGFSNSESVMFLDRSYALYFTYSSHYTQHLQSIRPVAVPVAVAALFLLLNIIALLLFAQKRHMKAVQDGIRANQMLFFMNHEVRNPLNIIKGMVDYTLESLNEDVAPLPECRDDLRIVARTCDFLEHIVSDIRVLQQLEDNTVVFKLKTCQLSAVLQDLVKSVRPKLDENKRIQMYLDCSTDIQVLVDEFRLKQILLNLMVNAIKYTKEGTIHVTAQQQQRGEGSGVTITVRDTGIGIPAEKQGLIFKTYFHADSSDMGRHGQFGLGLYLVKSLAEHMGWSVGFTSAVHKGSVFFVEIPQDIELGVAA